MGSVDDRWESFVKCYADVDENPWGIGYKVVMRKLNSFRPPAITCAAELLSIIANLFTWRAEVTYSVRGKPSPQDRGSTGSQIWRLGRQLIVMLGCLDKFLMLVFKKGGVP